MKKMTGLFLLSLLSLAALSACGGGSGSAATGQQKTATITFGIFGNFTSHISGVAVSARLPAGVTVALDQSPDQLRQPDLSSSKGTIFGTYSSSIRQVNIAISDINSNIGYGDFATLKCSVLPGVTLSADSFKALNTPLPYFKAVGYYTNLNGTTTTISTDGALQGRITPTMDVTFGY